MASPDWPSTHETLIFQLQERSDGPAWDLFAEVYWPLIYRYCRRRAYQTAEAEDAASETFLAVQKGIRSLNYDRARGRFRSWLGTIAIHKLNAARKKQNQLSPNQMAVEQAVLPNDEAGWIVEFNSHILEMALARIKPRFESQTWEAFELLWRQDRPPVEVAARFGQTRAWADRIRFRVLKRLEEELRFLTADMPGFHRDERG